MNNILTHKDELDTYAYIVPMGNLLRNKEVKKGENLYEI